MLLAKSFIAVLLVGISSNLMAQAEPSTTLKEFSIVVEKTKNGIKMTSLKGSSWLNLEFSAKQNNPKAIDEYGMAQLGKVNPAKDPQLADYLFTVEKTQKGITLKGIEGTAWKDLSFNLAKDKKQTFNQLGMVK